MANCTFLHSVRRSVSLLRNKQFYIGFTVEGPLHGAMSTSRRKSSMWNWRIAHSCTRCCAQCPCSGTSRLIGFTVEGPLNGAKPLQEATVVFPVAHDVIALASGRLLNQVFAQLVLFKCWKKTACKNEVYLLPNELDEKVAKVHLGTR